MNNRLIELAWVIPIALFIAIIGTVAFFAVRNTNAVNSIEAQCRNLETGVAYRVKPIAHVMGEIEGWRYRDENGLERTINSSNSDQWQCEALG